MGPTDGQPLSGKRPGTRDHGDWIIYTGHGGRNPNTGVQMADQTLTHGNRALAVSQMQGHPVRVIRGPKLKSEFAPTSGYRYDGLYYVEDHWQERGRAGFVVWRYRLRRDDASPGAWEAPQAPVNRHDLQNVEPRQSCGSSAIRRWLNGSRSHTILPAKSAGSGSRHRLVRTPRGPMFARWTLRTMGPMLKAISCVSARTTTPCLTRAHSAWLTT